MGCLCDWALVVVDVNQLVDHIVLLPLDVGCATHLYEFGTVCEIDRSFLGMI